ncbi:MAG TPA: hypothetical protein V6D23_16370 [Candidatus Obscuribacterales bacterium]
MRYSPSLLEGFLQQHESIVWTLLGQFDSLHAISGRRLKRRGCLVATPWRLLFVSIGRDRIQLESITFAQIDEIELHESLLLRTLVFSATGNTCRMRCLPHQPVRLNMYWLRRRVDEIQTGLPWHTEGANQEQAGPLRPAGHEGMTA